MNTQSRLRGDLGRVSMSTLGTVPSRDLHPQFRALFGPAPQHGHDLILTQSPKSYQKIEVGKMGGSWLVI